MAHILIIDDEEVFARNIAKFLEKSGHLTTTALTADSGLLAFHGVNPDMIILDYLLPDSDGLKLLAKFRAEDPNIPVLMLTGHGSIELAVNAMKAGANDLLTKPVGLEELRQRIERFAAQQKQTHRLRYFEARDMQAGQRILGESPAIVELRGHVQRMAAISGQAPPVLIRGETGTGKELVARALHDDSPRHNQAFIELNCAAIPSQLLESELFGHEKGAFTDAKERKIGLIEAADGGTLFLDELGEMDLALQAKLLKVLEDGRFRRLGSLQERQVDIRIVAATNCDLEALIQQGRFRNDLYFRLRVLTIDVPPLRTRGNDIVILASHFLDQFALRYHRQALALTTDARKALLQHSWPGNVRELRNVMEQAVLLAPNTSISASDLLLPRTAHPDVNAQPDTSLPGSLVDQMERTLLVQAIEKTGGNISSAARALGISRDTMRYRIEKHKLHIPKKT